MSIQSIPPGPPTTAGQLAARATQNDQILAAAIAEAEDRLTDVESRSGTSVTVAGTTYEPVEGTVDLGNAVVPFSRGLLDSGADFNAMHLVSHIGTWRVSAGIYPNAPTTIPSTAVLEVWRNAGTSVVQRLTAGNRMWWREATDATNGHWAPWVEAAVKSDLDGLATADQIHEAVAAVDVGAVIERSTNLFDRATVLPGHVIPAGSGVPVTSTGGNNVSAHIPVSPGSYTYTGVTRVTYFDASGGYVHFHDLNAATITRAAPAGTATVRLSVHNSNLGLAQMNAGSDLLPYEPHYRRTSIPDLSVTARQARFVGQSSNLLDRTRLRKGYRINATTGELESSPPNWVSEPITVEPAATYTMAGPGRVAQYDQAGIFLSTTTAATWTTDSTAATVRVSVNQGNLQDARLALASTAPPYEPYRLQVADVPIPRRMVDLATEDRYTIDGPLDGEYVAPMVDAQPGLWPTVTTDVHGWYDDLVTAHPEYVTRTDLGVSSDGATPMVRYDLRAPQVPTLGTPTLTPRLLLISGVHGYEKAAVFTLYQVAKALCESDGSTPGPLDVLRWNFHITIIPVGSPYSYDTSDGTAPNNRRNANGVDIARNFPALWTLGPDPDASTYGGTEPLSEPESILINEVMVEAAGSGAVWGTSFHNFTTAAATPTDFLWIPAASGLGVNVAASTIARLSRRWKPRYPWLPQDQSTHMGYAELSPTGGNESKQMTALGFHGSTFETSRIMLPAPGATAHDSISLTLGTEATAVYIAAAAKAGVDFVNSRMDMHV